MTLSDQEDSIADLVRMLTESISSSHLPIAELPDSLRFCDWKNVFSNLKQTERIYCTSKQDKNTTYRGMLKDQLRNPLKVISYWVQSQLIIQHGLFWNVNMEAPLLWPKYLG